MRKRLAAASVAAKDEAYPFVGTAVIVNPFDIDELKSLPRRVPFLTEQGGRFFDGGKQITPKAIAKVGGGGMLAAVDVVEATGDPAGFAPDGGDRLAGGVADDGAVAIDCLVAGCVNPFAPL